MVARPGVEGVGQAGEERARADPCLRRHRLPLSTPRLAKELVQIAVGDNARGPVGGDAPPAQQDGALAVLDDLLGAMGHQQQGGALSLEVGDALVALGGEVGVPHRQGLVDDEDVRPHGGRHAEGEAHLHAAGVGADRAVEVIANRGEGGDSRQAGGHLLATQAKELAGHEGILSAGEIGVEAHAQFQQGGDPPLDAHPAGGGLGGAGDDLEQGALAGAVDAEDAERLAGRDPEADVTQHPGLVVAGPAGEPLGGARPLARVTLVGLADLLDVKGAHQSSSTSSPTRVRKKRAPRTRAPRVSRPRGRRLAASGQRPSRNKP